MQTDLTKMVVEGTVVAAVGVVLHKQLLERLVH